MPNKRVKTLNSKKIPTSQKANWREQKNILHHTKAFRTAWRQFWQAPRRTLITCSVLAMTILLATILVLALETFQQVTNYINSSSQVTIYLKTTSPNAQILEWLNELKKEPNIKEATYISKEAALKELAQQNDYQEILSNVDANPLPPVISLKLKSSDKAAIQPLIDQLKSHPLVNSINIDLDWLQRLSALAQLGNRISYLLTIVFGIGVIFIISHTIEGATQKNQEEMSLLQLIGASTSYVRRPFLYLGTLLGVGAGLLAVCLLLFVISSLKQPLVDILNYFKLEQFGALFWGKIVLRLLLISTLLGWVGAWLSFYKYDKIS